MKITQPKQNVANWQGKESRRSVPQLTKNLDSTGADSCTEERNLPRGIHPCSLRQRHEDIAHQRCDDGQNKNGEDGHVLPADIVFNLTESLGTLSVAAHSGVKVLPLPELENSVRKMKHVPAQGQSRGAQRITVSADIEKVKSETGTGGGTPQCNILSSKKPFFSRILKILVWAGGLTNWNL